MKKILKFPLDLHNLVGGKKFDELPNAAKGEVGVDGSAYFTIRVIGKIFEPLTCAAQVQSRRHGGTSPVTLETPMLWAAVDADNDAKGHLDLTVALVPTGRQTQAIDWRLVGVVLLDGGTSVFHVFLRPHALL